MRTLDNGNSRARRALVTLITIALILMPLHASAKRKRSAAPQLPATLVIYSLTEGARVEIDGKDVGSIPLDDDFAVEPGDHTIRLSKLGYSEHNDTFTAPSGGEVELEIDLIPVAGIVTISANAEGATVKVDGKIVGVTPFVDQEVKPGKVTLSIEAPGYEPFLQELQIVAGQPFPLVAKLTKLPEADLGTGAATMAPEFYEDVWFWTTVGAVVLGGVATALALTIGQPEGDSGPSVDYTLQIR
ncbi:MAG: PEGA domain-containing protein [Myxococcota bacterium]